MHISPINDPSAWFAQDLETNGKWIYHLNHGGIDDLDNALAVAKAAGRTVATVNRKSFPLSITPAALDKLLDALENGYGVNVFHGLPVEKYSKDRSATSLLGPRLKRSIRLIGAPKSGDQLGFHTAPDRERGKSMFVIRWPSTTRSLGCARNCWSRSTLRLRGAGWVGRRLASHSGT